MVGGPSVAIPPSSADMRRAEAETTPAEQQRAARRETSREGPDVPEPLPEESIFNIEPMPESPDRAAPTDRRPPRKRATRGRKPATGNSFTVLLVIVGAAALATFIVSIIVTRLGAIDYSDFVFLLVVFILASFLELKLKGGGKISLGLAPLLAALIALPVNLPGAPYSKISGASAVQVVWLFLLGSIVILVARLAGKLSKDDLLGMMLDYAGVGLIALVFYLLVKVLPKKPELLGHYTPAVLGAAAVSAALLFLKVLPKKPELLGHYTPAVLGAAAVSAALLFLIYLAKESYLLSAEGEFPTGVYFQSVMRKSWLPYSIIALTGGAMGLVFVGIGMWSLIIILPLLLVFMYAYNRVAATDQYLLETIRVLSAIPEETGMLPLGHADNVAELAVGVARELGLSPEDVQQVEYAAYLHDIGAITRQAKHGLDQRQLTEVEGVIAGGVDIVGKVDYLDVAAEILGGREGLRDRVTDVDKRRAVSLGAGILRAVDDFESLVQGNDFREPLSENNALTEMNLERGVKYDSKVLRAIARVLTRLPREFSSSAEGSPESSPFWGDQEG